MDWHWEDSSRREFEDWSRRNFDESSRQYWDDWSRQSSDDFSSFLRIDSSTPASDRYFDGNPELAAYWATLTLKQKIVGSLGSIAAGAAGAGALIALVGFLK